MEKPVINFCLPQSCNNKLHTGDICALDRIEMRRNIAIYFYMLGNPLDDGGCDRINYVELQ